MIFASMLSAFKGDFCLHVECFFIFISLVVLFQISSSLLLSSPPSTVPSLPSLLPSLSSTSLPTFLPMDVSTMADKCAQIPIVAAAEATTLTVHHSTNGDTTAAETNYMKSLLTEPWKVGERRWSPELRAAAQGHLSDHAGQQWLSEAPFLVPSHAGPQFAQGAGDNFKSSIILGVPPIDGVLVRHFSLCPVKLLTTLGLLIKVCPNLLVTLSNVRVVYIRRTTNIPAHSLVRAVGFKSGRHVWGLTPPSCIIVSVAIDLVE